MKTVLGGAVAEASPWVSLLEGDLSATAAPAVAETTSALEDPLQRARHFAQPLLAGELLDTGEGALAHADGVAAILAGIGAAPGMQAACYLVYAGDYLNKPEDVVAKAFGPSYASLVMHTRRLVQIQRATREAPQHTAQRQEQTELVRKMLLAFSRDLRVVLLRLASRLQTLRWHAANKQPCPHYLAQESRQIFAPLANRLGIWQIKWELEDLAFRFLEPEAYHQLARALQEKRAEREQAVLAQCSALQALLQELGIAGVVQGRPKHLYSIWKKMQGKALTLERVFDLRALRIVVPDVADCYAVLSRLHERYAAVEGEFDDYIARPKSNGYQSLHTVVQCADGRAMEVQIRTRQMHEHAEHGVAAHWAYKEAGAKGYAGVSASGEFEEQVAQARKSVLRQLLAWERDFVGDAGPAFDERIYVFTPQSAVVELCAGATGVDFAYALHTDLGHRCRGAKVDGVMVPLNTPLRNGQTVEVIATKEGGPSLDWLNPELGLMQSPRSRAKVRAWFNAQAQQQTRARGRELVEKLLQREGKTAIKLEDLASRLGFKGADALFEVVGKDEYSLRNIETLLRPPKPEVDEDAALAQRHSRASAGTNRSQGGVLVVGVDALLTHLSRCCRPAPPDAITGYVTRGKGVAIHRNDCSNLRHMLEGSPQRRVDVEWGQSPAPAAGKQPLYPLDLVLEVQDRPGLLRDVLELLAKDKLHVSAVRNHASKRAAARHDSSLMDITLEVTDAAKVASTLVQLRQIRGVRSARRR
ncbi:RelA/SpoT family protein [Roseateles sp. BYS180W]|uniref:GTP pyrophosphokinase n=1 Tax=Roseateles rivi TaxID=3299028 RepID=A0ABW7FVJ0_9BURK